MHKWYREFLLLRKGERVALLFMVFFLFASLVYREVMQRIPIPRPVVDSLFMEEVYALLASLEEEHSGAEYDRPWREKGMRAERIPVVVPRAFDPNAVCRADLEAMHLPEFLTDNWIKYLAAGGRFNEVSDLRRIYGMDSAIYLALAPSVVLERSPDRSDAGKIEKSAVESVPGPGPMDRIELNGADSVTLIRIRGIGPVYARRIIRYRTLLGGFVTDSQLWEVYGLDSFQYREMVRRVQIDTAAIKKIDINSATFGELLAHPYLDRPAVQALVHYRTFRGQLDSLEEVKDNKVIDSKLYDRIVPYLHVERNSE